MRQAAFTPAFPYDEKASDGSHWHTHAGMTLRDYFAAQALVACGPPYGGRSDDSHGRRNHLFQEHAERVYAIADAMLKAREQGL